MKRMSVPKCWRVIDTEAYEKMELNSRQSAAMC